MSLTRRHALTLLGAGPLALLCRPARASESERMFLFIFVNGGWDPTYVFADLLDSEEVDTEEDAQVESAGELQWVGTEARRTTRSFFETWGAHCCILNGLEVRSITHEACRRIVLTGGSNAAVDDWPAILAGTAEGWILPDLVLSGPAFTSRYSSSVMRIGPDGQLGKLLNGEVFEDSDLPVSAPSSSAAQATDAYMRARLDAFTEAAAPGRASRVATDLQVALDQLDVVEGLADSVDLGVETDDWLYVRDRVGPALDCFELGLTRCAVVEHLGEWDVGWDSHSNIGIQSEHFEWLFEDLDSIMSELSSRTGPAGGSLLDQVTIVVFSEMGRAPKKNTRGGKDHWTFTSAMLIGAGVAGGKVVGGYDDQLIGQTVDLETGLPDEAGTLMTASHLGATLMALAGIDPEEHLPGVTPIAACLA